VLEILVGLVSSLNTQITSHCHQLSKWILFTFNLETVKHRSPGQPPLAIFKVINYKLKTLDNSGNQLLKVAQQTLVLVLHVLFQCRSLWPLLIVSQLVLPFKQEFELRTSLAGANGQLKADHPQESKEVPLHLPHLTQTNHLAPV